MKPTLACARAGVTTGEWASALRRSFGEYRAPTGIDATVASGYPRRRRLRNPRPTGRRWRVSPREFTNSPPHAVDRSGSSSVSRASTAIPMAPSRSPYGRGMRASRSSTRHSPHPEQIVAAAVAEDVDVVGLSILSGSHRSLVPAIMNGLAAEGADDVVVVVGGIIPAEDEVWLIEQGVAEVFTPKDYDVASILDRVVNHLSVGNEPVPTSP